MRRIVFIFLLACPILGFAQANRNSGGQFSLGVRSTTSLFSSHSGIGTGFGGQFRLRFYEFLNSEWFADYITSGIDGLGSRTDYHIGWSVMFYPHPDKVRTNIANFKPFKPKMYFLAGHCFDYTRVQGNNPFYTTDALASRWSSAIQGGLGMHIPMTPITDLSVNAQYMYHFGKDIDVETRTSITGTEYLYVRSTEESGLEGHLLVTLSLNVRVADFWKDKKGALGNGPHIQEDEQQ